MILHLGVDDLPYSGAPRKRRRGAKVKSGQQTTGDVAQWLENKYGVMEVFSDAHLDDMAEALEDGLAGHLETALTRGQSGDLDLSSATEKIDQMFRDFLSNKEMDTLGVAGVPTQAALAGVNHRLGANRGGPRPSFIDTGLYQSAFKSWIE